MTTTQRHLWTLRHIRDHILRFLLGFPGYALRYGLGHALRFALARLWFMLTKRVIPVWFPGGYMIGTPQHLINHQSIFVERELWHKQMAGLKIRTICDVGSNFGQASLFYRREWPFANICMVDPLYVDAGMAHSVMSLIGLPNYTVQWAVSSSNGPMNLNICRDVGGLTASIVQYGGCEKIQIEGVSALDRSSTVFDLIKIDTDGSEMEVLACLTSGQWSGVQVLVIECVPSQLERITRAIRIRRPDMVRYRTGNIDYAWISSQVK